MIHINRFLDKIRAAESKKQNDSANFPMTVREAKDLHTDITKLLLHLQQLHELQETPELQDEVIKIEVTGGSF